MPRWGECLPGVTPISHSAVSSKAEATGTGTGGSAAGGAVPPAYEEDRDNGEGGQFPADDNTFVLPLKLSSCRVLLPQVRGYAISRLTG